MMYLHFLEEIPVCKELELLQDEVGAAHDEGVLMIE